MMTINIKSLGIHLIALATILIVTLIYFYPQIEGKVVQQGDIIQVTGMSKEIVDYNKSHDEPTLWTNSMFGGMPAYQINAPTTGNKLYLLDKILTMGMKAPIGSFLLGMILFYFSMLLLGVNPWLSLIGALFFGFSTNNVILYEAGHVSKIKVIMSCAPIIAGMVLTNRFKYLMGGALFTFGLGINIMYNHYQMTYYLGISLLILEVIYFVKALRSKELKNFIKAGLVLVLGSLLALSASTSRFWPTYEYSVDTMRGKPILASTGGSETSSSEVEGLAYDYAMQWSNGITDLFASFIPQVVGGSSAELVDKILFLQRPLVQEKKYRHLPILGHFLSLAVPPILEP